MDILTQSLTIKRATTGANKLDTYSTVGTANGLIQAISDKSSVSDGMEIGKEYICFLAFGSDVAVGDIIEYGGVKFGVLSVSERIDNDGDDSFYSLRLVKKTTSSLIS